MTMLASIWHQMESKHCKLSPGQNPNISLAFQKHSAHRVRHLCTCSASDHAQNTQSYRSQSCTFLHCSSARSACTFFTYTVIPTHATTWSLPWHVGQPVGTYSRAQTHYLHTPALLTCCCDGRARCAVPPHGVLRRPAASETSIHAMQVDIIRGGREAS